ncbi:hypothetical protein, partial [Streptomyces sp. 021-4]|uniref:hypothetical protein n=1 Tax=Streptomyces sp. 021-4 TaxID=2789260 RepID=UPI0039F5A6D6
SAVDVLLSNKKISSSADVQLLESLRRERLDNDTQLATLFDDLTKIESQFVDIDTHEKLILGLNAKVTESERRLSTALTLKNSLLEELAKYASLAVGKSIVSDVTQALLKPDPQFIVNFHQHIELKDEIQEQINILDANSKDLSGQSADLFSLMSIAKTLLSKTLSHACPVCNAQYESHNALL